MPIYQIDFRFVEVEWELWALGQYLSLLEPQIAQLGKEAETRAYAKLAPGETDEGEISLASSEAYEMQEKVIPRFMRGPFLVAVWACFEAAVAHIADQMRKDLGVDLWFGELRGEHFLDRARRYFTAVLRSPFDDDASRYARLCDLQRVRNSLAHSNGQRAAMSDDAWKKLVEALKRNGVTIENHEDALILTAEYTKAAYADAEGCLRCLIERGRKSPSAPEAAPA